MTLVGDLQLVCYAHGMVRESGTQKGDSLIRRGDFDFRRSESLENKELVVTILRHLIAELAINNAIEFDETDKQLLEQYTQQIVILTSSVKGSDSVPKDHEGAGDTSIFANRLSENALGVRGYFRYAADSKDPTSDVYVISLPEGQYADSTDTLLHELSHVADAIFIRLLEEKYECMERDGLEIPETLVKAITTLHEEYYLYEKLTNAYFTYRSLMLIATFAILGTLTAEVLNQLSLDRTLAFLYSLFYLYPLYNIFFSEYLFHQQEERARTNATRIKESGPVHAVFDRMEETLLGMQKQLHESNTTKK